MMKSAHRDDKLQPALEAKYKEIKCKYEYFKNFTQKKEELDTRMLDKMRGRILVQVNKMKINIDDLKFRLKIFEGNDDKYKRINFLVDARKKIEELSKSTAKQAISLDDFKKKMAKLLKRK